MWYYRSAALFWCTGGTVKERGASGVRVQLRQLRKAHAYHGLVDCVGACVRVWGCDTRRANAAVRRGPSSVRPAARQHPDRTSGSRFHFRIAKGGSTRTHTHARTHTHTHTGTLALSLEYHVLWCEAHHLSRRKPKAHVENWNVIEMLPGKNLDISIMRHISQNKCTVSKVELKNVHSCQ